MPLKIIARVTRSIRITGENVQADIECLENGAIHIEAEDALGVLHEIRFDPATVSWIAHAFGSSRGEL